MKNQYHVTIHTNYSTYEQTVAAHDEVAALVIALEASNVRGGAPGDNFPVSIEIERKDPVLG